MRFLISAGPTREHLDPVRFLSNRSTGRMGYAVAEAAQKAGHEVVLVSGPVSLAVPAGVVCERVLSACEMLAALERHLERCDVLVMCAAVADWRPAEMSDVKLKKRGMEPVIRLVPNPDILKTLLPKKGTRIFVGFAAETHAVEQEAQAKLEQKGLDMLVANDVTQPDAGFEVSTNRVIVFSRASEAPEHWPLMSKTAVAEQLVKRIEARSGTGIEHPRV